MSDFFHLVHINFTGTLWHKNLTHLFLHGVLLALDFYSNLCSSSQNRYVGCLKSTLLFDTIALQLEDVALYMVQRVMLTFF